MRLCNHVLLAFVESDLAERDGAHHHVDGGGDEAVDADLVVQIVDVLRRTLTVKHKQSEMLSWDKLTFSLFVDSSSRQISSCSQTSPMQTNQETLRTQI